MDRRWGRTYESFGDDPEFVANLGAAAVRGLQNGDLAGSTSRSSEHGTYRPTPQALPPVRCRSWPPTTAGTEHRCMPIGS